MLDPKIEFDPDEVIDYLYEQLQIGGLLEKVSDLKRVDFNPFDEDGDEYVGVFQEMGHNCDLIWSATLALVRSAEALVVGGISLTSPEKHKVVVKALDRAIRLPWYAEPFDGPLLDVLVTIAVTQFNRIGWGIDEVAELNTV